VYNDFETEDGPWTNLTMDAGGCFKTSVTANHFAQCSIPALSLHQHRNENLNYKVSPCKSKQTTFVQSHTMQAYLNKYIVLTYMLHVSAYT
jgi:hypothetical protein